MRTIVNTILMKSRCSMSTPLVFSFWQMEILRILLRMLLVGINSVRVSVEDFPALFLLSIVISAIVFVTNAALVLESIFFNRAFRQWSAKHTQFLSCCILVAPVRRLQIASTWIFINLFWMLNELEEREKLLFENVIVKSYCF